MMIAILLIILSNFNYYVEPVSLEDVGGKIITDEEFKFNPDDITTIDPPVIKPTASFTQQQQQLLPQDEGAFVVSTPSGLIRGVRLELTRPVRVNRPTQAAVAFLGVPFARAPVGGLRFRSPEPAGPWEGVLDATLAMPACRGKPGPHHHEHGPYLFEHARNVVESTTTTSEDCLYLNVYIPEDHLPDGNVEDAGELSPVVVYIHGGSFETGSSNDIEASMLSVYGDVIVVTINYRLWYYGFVGGSNFGIEDQLLALQWVSENVRSFNGDPGQVTVVGFDAGATSAHIITTMPKSHGLINKLVLINGCRYTPTLIRSNNSAATDTSEDMLVLDSLRQCPENETAICLEEIGVDLSSSDLRRDDRPIPTIDNSPNGTYSRDATQPTMLIGFLEIGANWLNRTDRIGVETIRSSTMERVLRSDRYLDSTPLVSAAILFQYTAPDPGMDVELLAKMLEDFLLLAPLSETIKNREDNTELETFAFVHEACEGTIANPRCLFEPHVTGHRHNLRHHSGDFITYLINFIHSGDPSSPHKVPETWRSLTHDDGQSEFSSPNIYFPTSPPRKPITLPHGYRQHYVDFWSRFLPSIPTYQQQACHKDVTRPSDDPVTYATTTWDLYGGYEEGDDDEVLVRLPRAVATECPPVENCTEIFNKVIYDKRFVIPLSVFLCIAIFTILLIILLLSYLLAKRAEYNYIRGPSTHSTADDSPVHHPTGDNGALVTDKNIRTSPNPGPGYSRTDDSADEGGFDELGNLRTRAPLAQSEQPGESPML